MQLRENLYFQFANETEYSTLQQEKHQIIADGLKRFMCLTNARMANMPHDVSEICRDYELL